MNIKYLGHNIIVYLFESPSEVFHATLICWSIHYFICMDMSVPAELERYPRVMNAYMYNIICDWIFENRPYCLTFDIIDN